MNQRLLVVAVAARLPGWAEQACAQYVQRMPRGFETRRVTVKPEPRDTGKPLARVLALEAQRIEAQLPAAVRRVALDERGTDLSSAQFAAQLRRWLDEGDPTAMLIGGADGIDAALKKSCVATIRLSSLTLPHALAQLLLCEQLYRAATLLTGHPYHRE
ncbi:MAG: 23S rRNA (pseudouridine(1915)-N(3))-methyltransferase RlmH [Betaproteobacteria bacterium]|nr:23S rRNA (pseudouridine(1915)-N(3))-methyltransferase RlmH [Betaproteobacteria bacterium]